MPKNGRGQFLKISKYLSVHSTLVSQILSGHKDFTLEQAFKVCDFFGLNELESDYFMLMVQLKKAGTFELEEYYLQKLEKLEDKFKEVSSRVSAKKNLNENDKALYYSDWSYMAVWLLCGMDKIRNANDIKELLDLPIDRVNKIISFLKRAGLIIENKDEILSMGKTKTHLDRKNPLVSKHHTNWRLKAIEGFSKLPKEELAFSAPLTISKKDFAKVKKEILELIERTSSTVSKTEPELLACMSIDFFKI